MVAVLKGMIKAAQLPVNHYHANRLCFDLQQIQESANRERWIAGQFPVSVFPFRQQPVKLNRDVNSGKHSFLCKLAQTGHFFRIYVKYCIMRRQRLFAKYFGQAIMLGIIALPGIESPLGLQQVITNFQQSGNIQIPAVEGIHQVHGYLQIRERRPRKHAKAQHVK